MDKESARQRLEHIRQSIGLIQSFVRGQSFEDFSSDIKGQNATLYQFLIIGECVRILDPTYLQKYDYPWHVPRSFRNYIAHEYHKVKLKSVFNAANDLETLKKTVDEILAIEV